MPRLPHPRTSLSGYADDRLPAWRRALLGYHLGRCTRCAVRLAELRGVTRVLRSLPVGPGPSKALLGRLLAIDGHAEPPAPPSQAAAGDADGLPVHRPARAGPGGTGVLVLAVVLLGTAGTGAVVTAVSMPWPSTSARASVEHVLPRLWWQEDEPRGAGSVQPVDNGRRP